MQAMRVAIMFSGGKDSTFAVDYALERKWKIEYLLSVKPTRNDCFLFHYATVEHTPKQAEILGLKHKLITCNIADPKMEAELVRNEILKEPVDAVILGGTGLQETQIKSIQQALLPHGIEVFASHAGQEHDDVMKEMINKGYKFMITQVASDGLNKDWLGRVLDKETMTELFQRSIKYGFHCGGEGGYYDTFVLDGPIFDKRIEITQSEKIMESDNSGHLIIKEMAIIKKITREF